MRGPLLPAEDKTTFGPRNSLRALTWTRMSSDSALAKGSLPPPCPKVVLRTKYSTDVGKGLWHNFPLEHLPTTCESLGSSPNRKITKVIPQVFPKAGEKKHQRTAPHPCSSSIRVQKKVLEMVVSPTHEPQFPFSPPRQAQQVVLSQVKERAKHLAKHSVRSVPVPWNKQTLSFPYHPPTCSRHPLHPVSLHQTPAPQLTPTCEWRVRPLARLGGLPGGAGRCWDPPASPAAAAPSSSVCGGCSGVTAPGSSSARLGAPGRARPGEQARGASAPSVGSEGSLGSGSRAGAGSPLPALPCPDPGDSG